ncbi:hypothetical protein Fleli_1683 [Bernardetia litoralis DSM 6794]|uniref:Uncharacterized protein n=1 Tax=Bernardetia litoralis (strain ATCC 23117 / DSM 6794 / NBRC 15988 / NCIMB 1366 / Fx l1 / Sio-4) TaxID=880071 RepID=I4AJF8_BERLS|nr:DUF6134 family protein [Bernardetia litoralis]AFM04093.1 hypothetical protein Fleli_1683 [Bernardetia litoralis DSM 6794]
MTWYLVLLSFIICQFNFSEPSEKKISYDIIWKEKSVGTLYATQKNINSKTYYHSSTNIQIKFIKTFDINYEYDVIFDNQILQTANVDINYNGNQHAQTNTKLKNNEYQVIKDDELETTWKETIHYSTISMYFKEPINIKRCYSEQEGDFNTITHLGNHKYKKVNSSGRESFFFYKNGNLDKAVIDGGIVSFEMIRK